MMHPAAVLIAWLAVLVTCERLAVLWIGEPQRVAWLTAVVITVALVASRPELLRLLRRARWLLLALVALGPWTAPGELVAWLPGATIEGFRFALLQLARLLVALALLAMLLRLLSVPELIAAMHWCLAPLRGITRWPDVAAVRLALVLERLGGCLGGSTDDARHHGSIVLGLPAMRARDWSIVCVAVTITVAQFAGWV